MRSNTAENGILYYEAAQVVTAMTALSDSGDHQQYTSGVTMWSDKSGYSPVVRPDGLISGGIISPDSALVNNKIDVTAGTCYLIGVLTSPTAGDLTCARTADAVNPCIITSVIITAAGAFDVLQGLKGAALSETRGAAGGPALITVGCIEVGQVRYTSETDALVTTAEIFQTVGTHQERWDYPLWEEYFGRTQDLTQPGGNINFLAALPASHVGPVTKSVYASYAEPQFAEVAPVTDFVPPGNSHSVSSKQVYGGTIGSRSSTLNQGSFTAFLSSGVNDALLRLKDYILWFKYYPDRYKTPYIITQGKLGVSRSFPADDSITATCTISASEPAVDVDA